MNKITKQEARVLDNLGVALGVVDRWANTIKRENEALERTALYDEESGAPINGPAKVQSSVSLLLDEHLFPAIRLMTNLTDDYDRTVLPEEDRATEEVTLTEDEAQSLGV